MKLEKTITQFLDRHLNRNKPALLAFSGGPDSLALLHLLLQHNVDLHIAHVDHGWRPESAEEARTIQQMADTLKIPCHIAKLDPHHMQGNLEAASREARLSFFHTLSQQYHYQAVFLGHHADDQAETVIKKVFEGSSLIHLSGMHPVSILNGMVLWRPLLAVKKQDINAWLESKQLNPFIDKTNEDPYYLRARLRTSVFPFLNQQFGKEMSESLCRLSDESDELKHYLHMKTLDYANDVMTGPMGTCLDLSHQPAIHPFELKFLIRQVCESENIFASRHVVASICDMLLSGVGNKQVIVGKNTLYIDRKRLFICRESGDWTMSISKANGQPCHPVSWKDVWRGQFSITIAEGEYHLAPVDLKASIMNGGKLSSIDHWWTNNKVPAFLRHRIPVLWQKDKIAYEFLSGKMKQTNSKDVLLISIDFN